jgi:hypothetical protein
MYKTTCGMLAGKHAEVFIATKWYEPKYGIPEKIEDFTSEHRAYCEES